MTNIQGDLLSITTFDGKILYFAGLADAVLAYFSFGSPPVEFETRRGYKQDGVTEIGYTLSPRNLSMTIYRNQSCSREQYWQRRTDLLNFLRHNRNGPLTITLKQANGIQRAITARANPGPLLDVTTERNNWDIEETVQFVAFDPLFFNPESSQLTLAATISSDLVFPITFPIVFGAEGLIFESTIAYPGTWVTYPQFFFDGPYQAIRIENVTTGVEIGLNQAINVGDSRFIDLTPGVQQITDQNDQNKFSELTPESNLVDFNIRPDPEVPGGVNIIRVTMYGPTAFFGTAWEIQIEADGPERWYRLRDVGPTVAVDEGPHGQHGTYTGVITAFQQRSLVMPGTPEGRSIMPGVGGWVEIPPLDLTGDWTIEFWVSYNGGLTPILGLFEYQGGAGANQSLQIYKGLGPGPLTVDFQDGSPLVGSIGLPSTSGPLESTHVAISRNNLADQCILYQDGVQIGINNGGPLSVPNPTNVRLAVANSTDYWGNRLVSEYVIYTKTLSGDQIQRHYATRQYGIDIVTPAGVLLGYNERFFGI